ncbi:hypothetical protein LTR70_002981 [Exophiala xenobiotica]|uniref:DUF974 domain protein n=1 Tax=Lithohypha guttulata TaxID=1690604 RepID=A0ABR0K5Y1_9EURO|nr:hypothetical protein LTR24_006534 [Lithohypha guttulata]KAK5324351.1 hypothetical protein LTR70_002981 [Exophiala xenobiotica]
MLIDVLVLRLARPSLAQQHPLAYDYLAKIPHSATLAVSAEIPDQEFLLSSNLSLPPAFGSAYVGEIFSCSLCANNELPKDNTTKSITGVRLTAEMQTPSQQHIPLATSEKETDGDASAVMPPGASIQRIVRFDLKEEGNHILVVNLTYTETTTSEDVASEGKVRSFRKLYQFQAQPCLSVRTKATELASREVPDKSLGPYGRSMLVRYVLEAQLENVSEGGIVLQQAKLLAYPPFVATSLNFDMDAAGDQKGGDPLLNPRDVLQLAFLVEQDVENTEGADELKANIKRDGRTPLGQIALEWSSGMGEKGQLTTGTLSSRKRA